MTSDTNIFERFGSVLSQGRPAIGNKDLVLGQFGAREAKFGIEKYAGGKIAQYYFVYALKLEKPQPVPLFLIDKCPVFEQEEDGPDGYYVIRMKEWLVRVREFDDLEEAEKFSADLTMDAVRQQFQLLETIAGKLDRGEISIEKAVQKSGSMMRQDIIKFLPIAAVVAGLIYFFLLKR